MSIDLFLTLSVPRRSGRGKETVGTDDKINREMICRLGEKNQLKQKNMQQSKNWKKMEGACIDVHAKKNIKKSNNKNNTLFFQNIVHI